MQPVASVDERLAELQDQRLRALAELEALRSQVSKAERHLQELQRQIDQHDCYHPAVEDTKSVHSPPAQSEAGDQVPPRIVNEFPLTSEEYQRYGRQLIIPAIGASGQTALCNAKVLIVGVGGLGCPAAAYLAGAGVGTIGLVDGDNVEVSNLHRQIAHSTHRIGMKKVTSAYEYLKSINPLVNYEQHTEHLSPEQAVDLFEKYDIVLDCTDHPTSRYLISDACILARKPLVSASALKTEGQLIVLNNPAQPAGNSTGGPCYRCIFPRPPPAETIVSCGESGILGPVVGVMGILQALETIKILTARSAMTTTPPQAPRTSMLLFSAYGEVQFRTIKMRSRKPGCAACSDQHAITRESLTSGSLDYVAFCGAGRPVDVLSPARRTTASILAQNGFTPTSKIIDVRDKTQFEICSLAGSVNVPWTGDRTSWLTAIDETDIESSDQIFLICRLGNDSQAAALALMDARPSASDKVMDVTGGFEAWRRDIDTTWPDY